MCALTAPCVCICVYFYEWKDINKHITACKKTNRIDLEYRMNKGRNPAFKSFHCPFVPPDLCTKFQEIIQIGGVKLVHNQSNPYLLRDVLHCNQNTRYCWDCMGISGEKQP